MARQKHGPTLQQYPGVDASLLANPELFPPLKDPMNIDASPICAIITDDCRSILSSFKNSVDLIITSPPYADARKKHYDSIHPDHFVEWFRTFHEPLWNALKPSGSLIINIKDKVVNSIRH